MKCWECKQKTNTATIVNYLQVIRGIPIAEKSRDVCPACYLKLKFNPCHYIELDSLQKTAKSYENIRMVK